VIAGRAASAAAEGVPEHAFARQTGHTSTQDASFVPMHGAQIT